MPNNGDTASVPTGRWNHKAVPDPVANTPLTDERKPKLPPIEHASDMLAEVTPTPRELVVGLIHLGAKVVIGGGSKSYKTWLLAHLALCVANGLDWLGFPTTKGHVLFINLEIQRVFFRGRLSEISRVVGGSVSGLDVWNLRGHAADISLLIGEILETVGTNYDLIVVDPIYKVLGKRDENAAGDVGSLLNELERLAVQSNAAVVFGAHFSKGNQAGKESIDRIGGSGVYARDPDTILVLTRHEEDDAFTAEATLRNHPPIEPFVLRWNYPLMERDGALDPTKLKQVGGAPRRHTEDDLLEILGKDELSMSEWEQKAADPENGKMGSATFYRIAKTLKQSKRVKQSEISRKWYAAKA